MTKPHVVILGAGFGGMYVARHLQKFVDRGEIDITIVNSTNYFLFTPLLHEVATGGLSAASVAEPLREIFHNSNIRIFQGEIKRINTQKKMVACDQTELPYDYLVIATGATTNFYNIPGAKKYSLPLKNLADALTIKDRIIDVFEYRRPLNFVVVGGGATGVETVAELAEFCHQILFRHASINLQNLSITLVSSRPELLHYFDAPLRRVAEERLRALGIKLILGVKVAAVTDNHIRLEDGQTLPTSLTIWTAGVKPNLPSLTPTSALDDMGRLATDEYSRLISQDKVFALGDAAAPLPMLAQAAVVQARTVARNLINSIHNQPLEPIHFQSKGDLLSLGQWFGIGRVFGIDIKGRFTWWLWRTVYLFKFLSWKKRLRITFEWTLNIFYPRDITKPN